MTTPDDGSGMAAADGQETTPGDGRRGERRMADRRRTDRRAPVPPWRRPWALVAYGAVGMLLLFWLFGGGGDGDDDRPTRDSTIVAAPPAIDTTPTPPRQPGVENALTTADFERLTLESEGARGRVVKAQLFCDAPAAVAVQTSDSVEAAVAALLDTATQRVPAAECKWGAQDDPRREDFLLLVPPDRADEFSRAPVILDGFVRRRRLIAQVEWIGKSRSLALRSVGVFRGLTQ